MRGKPLDPDWDARGARRAARAIGLRGGELGPITDATTLADYRYENAERVLAPYGGTPPEERSTSGREYGGFGSPEFPP